MTLMLMNVFHRNSRSRRTACRRVLLCVLMLSLWRAPIPWLDAHGTLDADGRTSSGSAIGLVKHLLKFHPGVDPFSARQLGWHVHFVLPWEGLEQHQHRSPQQPHDIGNPLASSDVVGSTPAPVFVSNHPAAGCAAKFRYFAASVSAPHRGACRFAIGPHVRGFLGTYGATGMLRALLGVALC